MARIPPAVRQTIRAYRSEENFLNLFNPSKQIAYTRNLDKVFRGAAPSLDVLAKAFGNSTRDSWLDIQITELAAFSGCRDKLTDHQREGLIEIIVEDYGYLKVTELMYFFRQFKSGEYGKFYGAVDPIAITAALKDFIAERRDILRRLAQKEDEAKRLLTPEDKSWENNYLRYLRMCTFYSLNFRSEDFTLEEFSEIWWLFNLGYERSDHGYKEQ